MKTTAVLLLTAAVAALAAPAPGSGSGSVSFSKSEKDTTVTKYVKYCYEKEHEKEDKEHKKCDFYYHDRGYNFHVRGSPSTASSSLTAPGLPRLQEGEGQGGQGDPRRLRVQGEKGAVRLPLQAPRLEVCEYLGLRGGTTPTNCPQDHKYDCGDCFGKKEHKYIGHKKHHDE